MRQNRPQKGVNRRDSLGLILGSAVSACTLPARANAPATPPAASLAESLAELATAKGMRFGTAIGIGGGAFHDPKMRDILIRECNIIVPENELKMYVTHNRDADSYNFAPADDMLAWASENHMAMRGHNLIWARDEYTPMWLNRYDFGDKPKVKAEAMIRDYIAKVCDHYGDRLTSWDVVNEAVDPKTGQLRSSVFTRILGPDALRIAYSATREHLPKTQLVYNDYMSWETGNETHCSGVLNILNWLHKNNCPIDALGVQSHIGNGFGLTTGQPRAWKAFLDEAVAMGLDLLITEFDVDDQTIPSADITVRDQQVAATARQYLDQMLDYKQLKDVLMWGMQDHYCWLQTFTPRADKAPLRPTPYDDHYQPKPLREAIAAAFKTARAR